MLDPSSAIVSTNGRAIKFTPERLEQIRNLVERGHNKKEIAEIIGCTVGSLQVTCSRLSISLRRPRRINDAEFEPRREKPKMIESGPPSNVLEPPGGWPRKQGQGLKLKLECSGRSVDLPLDSALITDLILLAEVRGLRLSELLTEILRAATNDENGAR